MRNHHLAKTAIRLLAVAVLLLCSTPADAGWWNTSWGIRRKITFNNTGQAENLQNFPVLIRLDSSRIEYANTQNGGEDLRFVDADDMTLLDHEIELWNESGTSWVWVRVPQVNAGSATDYIIMYYDNPAAPPLTPAQQEATWDVDFKLVQHLNETSGTHFDSTSNGNDSIVVDVATQGSAAGRIDGADRFIEASSHNVDIADDPTLNVGAGESMTVEAWIRTSNTGLPMHIASKEESPGAGFDLMVWFDEARFTPYEDPDSATTQSTSVADGAWHYVVGRWDRATSTAELFVDGVSVDTATNALVGSLSGSGPFVIGEEADGSGGFHFDGNIDEVRFSKVARSDDWIRAQHLSMTDAFASFAAPTAVTLQSFEARGLDSAVELSWSTASELDNLGFHLYRSLHPSGPYERITGRVVPGLGSSPQGARYRYVDSGLVNGTEYFYQLEDIETSGMTKRHGPVSATAGESGSAPLPPTDSDQSRSSITYGDPGAANLHVLRERDEIVLELLTPGFTAEPTESGEVRPSVPGLETAGDAGAPALPLRRAWVDATAGRGLRVTAIEAHDVVRFSGLRPTWAGAPEVVSSRRGVTRAVERPVGRRNRRGGVLPAEWARLATVGYQGDVKKALVELSPLRYDSTSSELVLARRLVVRLAIDGVDPTDAHEESVSHDRRQLLKRLVTSEAGLHAVSFQEIFGSHLRAVAADSLRLSRLGEAVPFHLEPDGRTFGPGSTLYFLSEGGSANPYGAETVYELDRRRGLRMEVDPAAPLRSNRDYYWHRVKREQNLYYQAALVDAPDVWLWDLLFAPVTKSYPFDVSGLASVAESGSLSVWLQGTSDFPEVVDHHVRVYVNGVSVGESRWDGKTPERLAAAVPPGVLHDGTNQIAIESTNGDGALYSMVMLDRFEVSYPRALTASRGAFEGSFSGSGVADVSGFTSRARVVHLGSGAPRWLSGAESAAGRVRFPVENGGTYLAVDDGAIRRPRVEASVATRLKGPNRADYLVIGPKALLGHASGLVDWRRSQGLRTETVSMEEIYSEFGFGERRPEALREFLTYAYHHWREPAPKYVLLIGDGTYDFRDYLGTGVQNQVPPLMVRTTFLWTASDPAYASVNGEDPLPDVAIGRLPAANAAELRAMVQKILDFEREGSVSSGRFVVVADNPDEAGDFEADADEIASGPLGSRNVESIYLGRLGVDGTRAAITRAFDRGASAVSYIGHGGIHLWASENIFERTQVEGLGPQAEQPLVLTLNCLNGYFHFPYFNSLAEELLKAEGKGAIAVFSPSGMSLDEPAHRFHKALLSEIVSGRHQTLGDAVLAAQTIYAESGAFPELLSIYHLLGDPALRLGPLP